ncbi:MAG: hypothetical protein JG782_1001 [Anaerophaga sp.]|nr:hypothetical protein [Anaerophaga sp.]
MEPACKHLYIFLLWYALSVPFYLTSHHLKSNNLLFYIKTIFAKLVSFEPGGLNSVKKNPGGGCYPLTGCFVYRNGLFFTKQWLKTYFPNVNLSEVLFVTHFLYGFQT